MRDPAKYKVLFDPHNPAKPLYVHDRNSNSNNDDLQRTKSDLKQQQKSRISATQSQPSQAAASQAINEPQLQKFEDQLKTYIDTFSYDRFGSISDSLNELRKDYEKLYLESIQINIEYVINSSLDLNFWKFNYHHIIETLRKEYNQSSTAGLKTHLEFYINDGFRFYESLLAKLEALFSFNFKSIMKNTALFTPQYLPVQQQTKKFKCVLLCVHRMLISLGDLARYREMLSSDASTKDFLLARNYYLQAQKIIPKSSRSYNQLAILALYTRRRLDAVYYYIRCLELNSPLLTARQSLVSLFDEARKHSEQLTENLNKKSFSKNKSKQSPIVDASLNRVEFWFKPNDSDLKRGAFSLNSDNDEDEANDGFGDDFDSRRLSQISTSELNKRFMNDYLNTIG